MKQLSSDIWAAFVALAATVAAVIVPARLVLGSGTIPAASPVGLGITAVFIVDVIVQLRRGRSGTSDRLLLSTDIVAALPLGFLVGPDPLAAVQLLKLARVARFLHQWRMRHMGQWNVLRLVYFGYWLGLSVHWLSSGWVAIRGFSAAAGPWRGYLEAWYYCTVTLTTIGYGDITPITDVEIIYAIGMMIFGVAMYSYAIGNVANLVANLHPSRVRYLETMERLTAFMQYRRLPKSLQDRIREYTTYAWDQRLGYDESTFLAGLPGGLMTEVTLFLRRDIIQKVPFLQGAPEDLVRELAQALKQRVLTPGEFVFRAGDLGLEMYFISLGTVNVIGRDAATLLATLSDGDFFGEMALLLNRPRTASICAVGYCDLYTLDKATFDRIIAQHPHFAAHIEAMTRERGGLQPDEPRPGGTP